MDISEAAQRSNLKPSTLRYYEEKGLIQSVGRRGLRRLYHPNVLDRLALITLGRTAGFSLEEISRVLGIDSKDGRERIEIDKQYLLQKADELDESINAMISVRDGLKHAANCTAPRHLDCPKFRKLMSLSTLGKVPSIMHKGIGIKSKRKTKTKKDAPKGA
ncbi:helix-turn-helix domain-containing protein [Marinomonas mediterranea]|uniref:Transcriptional regulator, MerR family n=1 Tax=Marinomonas mediterranea (strain ATCC 700492 / JCM 21426 / NBRC 103028 / MMB-1) TaxID=717774 RepID=F2K3T9_MARM1|nr:helix-turn-helix domain-containing protein [Marinomonas mediterranea]ADZ90188.1 transcriptional regulator, MerR family [Marinomonas mediterranea MMB-1]WCN08249.1 MerR family transcriptional regulator [Marinomonas mediterranea]WCN12315.1 MerR family transcriptional regulator [Marinomonas mediterranea]WCN16387.1 MerR family transcriptional regulator [Marinomonas mediterranea MMB-1]